MEPITYPASKKRLLLSLYLDFLVFMTLWALLSYFLNPEANLPFWVPYALFVMIRSVAGKYVGSIGYIFLGIDKETRTVRSEIYQRENWLTMLLGVLFILEGTKQLVRWTQLFVSQPAFGFFPDETTQVLIHIMFGAASFIAGYWYLKLNIRGFYLGIVTALIHLISITLSWQLWDPVIEQVVLARRELQGIPVREGEVEFMQLLFPEGQLVAVILLIIAMLFTFKRFKSV